MSITDFEILDKLGKFTENVRYECNFSDFICLQGVEHLVRSLRRNE